MDQLRPIYNELLLYNLVLLIGYIWFYNKYNNSSLSFLIITIFFGGLFMDFGNQLIGKIIFGTAKTSTIGTGIWQLITFVWAIRLFKRSNSLIILKNQKSIIAIFIAYCSLFVITSLLINEDSISITFSELYKDLMPFLLFFVLGRIMQDSNSTNSLNLLFYRLINAQIIFTIAKFLILMRPYEGLVGSFTGINNGGPGTSLPLLGLIYIAINTKMRLRGKDLWMILGLLAMGFLAGKRAVWLLFPILYILLSIYVYRHRFVKNLIIAAILVPFFVYAGLRLMPTLNPENEVWGSFDPGYAWNYGQKYSMGKENASDEIEKGTGRVGALVLAIDHIQNYSNSSKNILFGYGLEYFNITSDKYYDSNYWWGIDGRGSITGLLYKYFSIGLIGTILYTIFIILLVSNVKNKRLKFIIVAVVLFDFIFYNATIITFPSLFALLIFEMSYNTSMIKEAQKSVIKFANTNQKKERV